MGGDPFFSILVPTKNRSWIVGQAIESVLGQTFGDFELIVSDNDDDPEKTMDAVQSFSDPRIRYFRTSGSLSMPDNWEFAVSKARGKYTAVLEDKQVFYPDALEILHGVLAGSDVKCAVWLSDLFDDTFDPPVFKKGLGSDRVSTRPVEEILNTFTRKRIVFRDFPRMLNSVVTTEFIHFVQNESGLGRFFDHGNPDFVAAFLQLNYLDRITYLDRSLNITGSRTVSTGYSGRKKGEEARRYLSEVGEAIFYDMVPIKAVMTNNSIINDYNRIRSRVDGHLRKYEMSKETYMMICYVDILKGEKLGTDMAQEREVWKKALASLDPHTARAVNGRVFKIESRKRISALMDRIPGSGLIRRLKNGPPRTEKITGLRNALEAAGYK